MKSWAGRFGLPLNLTKSFWPDTLISMDYVVIMAGGTGKRLWPLSRKKRPKQVLRLFDGQTLLRCCFQRLSPVFDTNRIIILTNSDYAGIVTDNLPELPADNIIAEPAVRDTAGAIGLAATVLAKHDSNATMAVVTADQLIEPAEPLQQAIKDALVFVNNNPEAMITFGIKPTFANTNLGYIDCAGPRQYPGCENKIYSVAAFKEKPDEKTASRYLATGRYFWNSGMFVWKAETVLSNLAKFLPEAVKLDCRWLDVGSFTMLADVLPADAGNNTIAAASTRLLDCKNNIFITEDTGHLIAAVGLENIIVAHSPDATLVCPIDQADRLKELLEIMELSAGHKEFL